MSCVTLDVSGLLRKPYPSLLSSYRQCMESLGLSQLNVNARLLFPIAVSCLRCKAYTDRGGVKDTSTTASSVAEDLRFIRFVRRCSELSEQRRLNLAFASAADLAVDDIFQDIFRSSWQSYYLIWL